MARRGSVVRSRGEWSLRVMLALLAAVVGGVGVTRSFAQMVARSDPALAHRMYPGSARAAALLAATLVGTEATPSDRRRAVSLARGAIRHDATAVTAVSILGIDAQVRGDVNGARRLFAYAQRLSRRDLPTQLWAIEDAVARGDVASTLGHYDVALRVSVPAAGLLFPVLTEASSDPAVTAALIRTLAARPPWGQRFIAYAAGNGADPRVSARFLSSLRQAEVPIPDPALKTVTDALLVDGAFDQAWRFYHSFRTQADRRRARDPGFTATLAAPTMFDWSVVDSSGMSAAIQRGGFGFAAAPRIGGPLLRQQQVLPSGTYRLFGVSSGIDQPDDALPYWTLTCRSGEELGRVVVPGSAIRDGRFEGTIIVPPGCPAQTLTLVASPSNMPAGLIGQIDRIELAPWR